MTKHLEREKLKYTLGQYHFSNNEGKGYGAMAQK
jgi:hypothetical protein